MKLKDVTIEVFADDMVSFEIKKYDGFGAGGVKRGVISRRLSPQSAKDLRIMINLLDGDR